MRVRAILVERQMRAGALVIVDTRGQDAAQMALVEDHDGIQALATNRTDHALDVSVMPRRAWCRDDLSDSHRRYPLAENRAVGGVAVA